jgi:hypothetical protein
MPVAVEGLAGSGWVFWKLRESGKPNGGTTFTPGPNRRFRSKSVKLSVCFAHGIRLRVHLDTFDPLPHMVQLDALCAFAVFAVLVGHFTPATSGLFLPF